MSKTVYDQIILGIIINMIFWCHWIQAFYKKFYTSHATDHSTLIHIITIKFV